MVFRKLISLTRGLDSFDGFDTQYTGRKALVGFQAS